MIAPMRNTGAIMQLVRFLDLTQFGRLALVANTVQSAIGLQLTQLFGKAGILPAFECMSRSSLT